MLPYLECDEDLKMLNFYVFQERLIDYSYDFLACETFVLSVHFENLWPARDPFCYA